MFEINGLNITINYTKSDLNYIEDLKRYTFNNINNICTFFEHYKLNKKVIINILDNIEVFKNRNESSVAFMDFDDNNYYINILSYELFIKRKGHENNKLEYMFKTIIHEFVHIIQEDKGLYKNCLIWIKEGVAIWLSKQYEGLNYKINNCSLNDLVNNNRVWYINYYSLIKYIVDTYGIEYLKNIIFNQNIQINETNKIYNEFLKFYNKIDNLLKDEH